MTSLPIFDLFVRLFAAAILIHDALYVSRDGVRHLSSGFLPVLGLRLSKPAKLALHAGLFLCCGALIFAPSDTRLYPVLLGLIVVKIASYPLRLSNHMILAGFISALLTLSIFFGARSGEAAPLGQSIVIAGVCGFILMLYGFAFFHKLNAEYIDLPRSCGTAFVDFFCQDRAITAPRLVSAYRYFGVFGTLIIEAILPVLLFFEETRAIGFLAAILFHYVLGLMGIINFSMFMYAGLIAFLPQAALENSLALAHHEPWAQAALTASTLAIVAISAWWTPRRAAPNCPYRHRWAAWIIQIGFAALTAALLFAGAVWMTSGYAETGGWAEWPWSARLALAAILAAFLLNGLSPYIGAKTEFSFAMFSNLRVEPWTHLLVPGRWRPLRPQPYIEVKAIHGLPTAAAVAGDPGAELALEVLSRPKHFFYSRYFFREALLKLRCFVPSGEPISVDYMENGRHRRIEDVGAERLGRCLRITRFPFVMPRDPHARHSEQGAVLAEGRERQMF